MSLQCPLFLSTRLSLHLRHSHLPPAPSISWYWNRLVQTHILPGIGSVHCVTHLFDSTSFKIVRWVECSPFQPGRANTIECGRNSQVRPLAPEFQLKYILYLYLSSPQQVISAYKALKGKVFITMNMKKNASFGNFKKAWHQPLETLLHI